MKDSPIQRPLVSIAVTSYNVADYLGECIRSIQAQTYSNLEIVVVDDCSTKTVCRRRQIFRRERQPDQIDPGNRNESMYAKLDGIRNTKQKYFLCDGDDWISPNWCEHP